MHWYGGSIAEAVTLSKQKNAIFVVFVEGDNDLSQEMAQTIDNSVVVSRLSNQTNFLAIKLKSGSTDYTHFAQIYQFVPVPSLFFIGRNGTPLEVVCAGVEPGNLATRIDRILEEHRKEKSPLVQPSTSSQSLKEQTVNMLHSEAASSAPAKPERVKVPEPRAKEPETSEPAAKIPKTENGEENKEEEYEIVCDGDVCVRRPKAADGSGTSKQTEPAQMETQTATATTPAAPDVPASSATVEPKDPPAGTSETEQSPSDSDRDMEDKLERAKELIEARRREKAEKEKELEKEKEIERRNAGKGVVELKKWQADQELKQIQEERKREKLENNLARQRILEQIAQDRAERRARDAPVTPAAPLTPPASANLSSAPLAATSGDGGTRARIQFKLPDGSSHTAHFDAHDTLGDVQRYVAQNLQLSSSSFSLWTAFPRRELDSVEGTLRALQLAPSAALLVLPRPTLAAVATPSTFDNIITFFTQLFTSLILAPSQQLYEWVRRRVFPAPPPRGSPPRGSPSPAAGTGPAPAPSPPPPPPGVRRRGNIHRLPGDSAGDDDNNTWNGNSTQQM